MAHLKSRSVNVTTGEEALVYFTDAEWEAREAVRVPVEFAARQGAAVLKNKSDVGDTILALYPDWKQRNMIARMIELQDPARALTRSEVEEHATLLAVWRWVNDERAAGDVREAAIIEAVDDAALDALGV